MSARVSVVVPCHNHGHLLGEALDSIATQGIDVEVIVVDDRSTDDTAEVTAAHGAKLVRSPGIGAGVARNAGAAEATGDVIAFLDADDVWTDGGLASRLAALEGHDAAYGAVEEFVDETLEGDHPEPRAALSARLPGTLVLTRRAWQTVGVIDESLRAGEFIDWVARFDAAGLSAVAVDEVVLRRRIHATNTTRTTATAASYLEVARMHRKRLRG